MSNLKCHEEKFNEKKKKMKPISAVERIGPSFGFKDFSTLSFSLKFSI